MEAVQGILGERRKVHGKIKRCAACPTPAWACAPFGTRLLAGSGSARDHGTGRPEARSMRATVWRQCANRRWPLASARPWAAGGTSGVWHRARNSARSDMARRASTPPRTAARSFTYRSNVATRRCSVSASNTWDHAPAEPIRLGRGLERRRHLLAQGEVLAQTVGDALRKRDLPGCRLELEPPVMLRREIGVHLAADIHGRLRKLRSCARAGLGTRSTRDPATPMLSGRHSGSRPRGTLANDAGRRPESCALSCALGA